MAAFGQSPARLEESITCPSCRPCCHACIGLQPLNNPNATPVAIGVGLRIKIVAKGPSLALSLSPSHQSVSLTDPGWRGRAPAQGEWAISTVNRLLAEGAPCLGGEGGGGRRQSSIPKSGALWRERGPPGCFVGQQPLVTVRDPGKWWWDICLTQEATQPVGCCLVGGKNAHWKCRWKVENVPSCFPISRVRSVAKGRGNMVHVWDYNCAWGMNCADVKALPKPPLEVQLKSRLLWMITLPLAETGVRGRMSSQGAAEQVELELQPMGHWLSYSKFEGN